jgi:hypothetical protein
MAINWNRLLQQAAKIGLEAISTRRGAGTEGPGGPTVTQIKADMTNIVDIHHRQHHNDWLTVVDTETRVGTRYVCHCSGGYAVYVDAQNVTSTRNVPEPKPRPQADPTTCGNNNPFYLT